MKIIIKKSFLFTFKTVIITFFLISNCLSLFSINYKAYRTDTPPVIDGIANENCWKTASWALINRPFDGIVLPDSADFYGRYKVVWDASRVYVFMEITDDKLVDNRVNPKTNYWEDDCTEFFIDEDHTPEGHECGVNAFKAFAYHIASVARDKNNYTNGIILPFDDPNAINHVVDLGSDCNTANVPNFDDHVKVKIIKNGNKYTWELEFKIFNKQYNENITNNIPVILLPNKVMGFAIAYCDDDSGVRDNMVGTIPNHNDYSGAYPFYRFTNEFGTLNLNDSVLTPPTAIHSINSSRGILIWPNPVGNILNIETENPDMQFNQIQIVNLSGTTILSSKFDINNTKINVSSISSGIYIMQISSSEGLLKQLFIKE
ncbi:MAG: hypothetical protein AUK44_02305 [Porphyromonadaceae bacterium CG2_30_38_12]|nr:MAG: hypothetical protein AUK44_02305 [Porphyromonadaceae bacterium CG2_30_38_12]